jgi:hypothetical protein
MPTSFSNYKTLDKPYADKKAISERCAEAVAEFLASGNQITTVKSRRRTRYVNPVPRSPLTEARCQMIATRKAGAKRVAHLFPSSVDPGVARVLYRGRGYGRRRVTRISHESY